MKIIVTSHTFDPKTYNSILHFTEDNLIEDCHAGVTESTEATTSNLIAAFGRLLDCLATKNLLTANEVLYIVDELSSCSTAEFKP